MCIRISCSGTPYHDVLSLPKSQPGFSTDDVDGLVTVSFLSPLIEMALLAVSICHILPL